MLLKTWNLLSLTCGSIAMGCIYTEAKNYPCEPAAHVAISENSFCSVFLKKKGKKTNPSVQLLHHWAALADFHTHTHEFLS